MKFFYPLGKAFAILLACAFPVFASAQWTDISPPTGTGVLLFDVEFYSDDVGLAVGQNTTTGIGYIFMTTDGGASWVEHSFTNRHLRSAAFTDANNIIVTGYDGPPGTQVEWIISNDQGSTWTESSELQFTGLNGLQFQDGQTGFAYGYATTFGASAGIMRTTDGGSTWTFPYIVQGELIEGIHFFDDQTGFVSKVDFFANGTIVKTTDGAQTFGAPKYSGGWLKGVTFSSATTGYAVEGLSTKNLVKTTDGGDTWSTLPLDDDVSVLAFVNDTFGYGIGEVGRIVKTQDGGNNWTDESPAITEDFEGSSITTKYAYACGRNGVVYRAAHGVEPPVGIGEVNLDFQVEVYPNPLGASRQLSIEGLDGRPYQITILALTGQELMNTWQSSTQISLDELGLRSGIYIYRIQTAEGVTTGKLILE